MQWKLTSKAKHGIIPKPAIKICKLNGKVREKNRNGKRFFCNYTVSLLCSSPCFDVLLTYISHITRQNIKTTTKTVSAAGQTSL